MRYSIIILILILQACSSADAYPKKLFFDFEAYIDAEVDRLMGQQIQVQKHYEFNGTVEDTIITVADWNKELRPFRIDINKPAWVAHVKIDTNAVSFAEYAIEYTFDSEKIPYRKAVIIYEDAEMSKVLEVLIVYRSDNYLYKAERELIYNSKDGYQINGVQDVKVLEDANYLIEAKFIH